jgi:hypothetical protein
VFSQTGAGEATALECVDSRKKKNNLRMHLCHYIDIIKLKKEVLQK